MDASPNCAICNAPPYPECSCESERLQIAVKQAEQRAMDERLAEIRDWVINHARQHILNAFERLTSIRKQAHSSYLASLPNYEVYMRYSGHPPLHPMYISTLQTQIAEAHAELKRGIDADWRASVLRYPEVLDYFYSLVDLRLPDDRSREVVEPPFAAAGYADIGYRVKEKKKKRRDRAEREGSVPQQPQMHMALRVMRGQMPPVPTPPIHHNGAYPRPPESYDF
ncbi:hypothetical protein GT037_008277 [Alternaria burnsii]|uniref:Uncharacterized protein n=5 Tax=Alternaria sect. Alternaria TaxID=2499237 RepID=A0A177DMI3_ALTAL|nr:hypothetical protein CC77DRAFT_1008732 [Alternaria alternata]XP_028511334.1 hypothetical protein AA0111_g1367 [Alternaria arborescens]XP_038783989.1 uncharacterized protein GT037_008277 [Alternaria burnsii]XP_051586611.1 uncharacterized protein J4E82_007451 [Alternaria postmessia]KAB2110832.1 hypothetical protein AG0111_0g1585 [Alternaria gaisen]RII05427.1 hypothetical protein CUC08_Gglean010522 [Alternaria sp. MG1]RYN35052.1 hypothetical protein AA0115_g2368 [Alternaria tenuissima]KAF767